MKISKLREWVTDNSKFNTIDEFISFCKYYLDYISDQSNLQAKIIAQNEQQYFFYQYNKDGNYQITRPINSELFLERDIFETNLKLFKEIITNFENYHPTSEGRHCINNILYTIQQTLGSTLDALPAGMANQARKVNGTLFEKLIVIFFKSLNLIANAESLNIPVVHNNQVLFKMNYQHDLVVRDQSKDVKIIGAIKTTTKDRIDKVFIDKLLYSKLTSSEIYHVLIVLNDIQRMSGKDKSKFSISSTFLPGRFKGYMIKLCPLDGVYYFDIRKAMQTDKQLKEMIQTFDKLVFDDMKKFVK